MKFGILSFMFLSILLIFGGGFAWLAFTDIPVRQTEIRVNVPLNAE